MFNVLTDEAAPAKVFATRQEAQAVADEISNKPRRGIARAQYVGYYDGWIVEVVPRTNRYSNPAVLRINGEAAKYH